MSTLNILFNMPETMLAALHPNDVAEQEMCFCGHDADITLEYERDPTAWLSKVVWGEVYENMITTTTTKP